MMKLVSRELLGNRHLYILVKWLSVPLALAVSLRILGGLWIMYALSVQGKFQTPWMTGGWVDPLLPGNLTQPAFGSWLYLFLAWDSAWYVGIAQNGYWHPAYVFLPAYPAIIRLTAPLVGDYWLAAFLVTQVFSLASLVVFQLLAREYMDARAALYATILMAFFPYVAVFSILSYTEPIFLFSTLLSWYLYRRGRMLGASLSAGLASLTKGYGILIVLPMIIGIIKSRSYRRLLYFLIPAIALGSWLTFCQFSTGNAFASWSDQSHWRVIAKSFELVQSVLLPELHGLQVSFDPAALLITGIFAFLIVKSWDVERALWVYAMAELCLLIFTAPTTSFSRFLSFIFPVWLTVKVRNPVIVGICVALFIPIILVLWITALQQILIA